MGPFCPFSWPSCDERSLTDGTLPGSKHTAFLRDQHSWAKQSRGQDVPVNSGNFQVTPGSWKHKRGSWLYTSTQYYSESRPGWPWSSRGCTGKLTCCPGRLAMQDTLIWYNRRVNGHCLTQGGSHLYIAAGELIPFLSKVSFMTLMKLPRNKCSRKPSHLTQSNLNKVKIHFSGMAPCKFYFGGGKGLSTIGIKLCSSQLLNTQQLFLELWETLQEPVFSQTCLRKAGFLLFLLSLVGMRKVMESWIFLVADLASVEERESTCDRSKFIR